MIETPFLVGAALDNTNGTEIPIAAEADVTGRTVFTALGIRLQVASADPSVTDDAITPATYARDHLENAGGTHVSLHRHSNHPGLVLSPPDNIDVEWDAGTHSSAAVALAVDGLDLSSPLDGTPDSLSATTATPSATVTPSAGQRLLIGVLAWRATVPAELVEDANFNTIATLHAERSPSSQSCLVHVVYRIVTADGSTPYPWAPQGSGNPVSIMLASYEAAPSAAPSGGNIIVNFIGA